MNFPRWMNWLFLAFFAYILYLGNFAARDEVSAPVVKPTKQADPSHVQAAQSGVLDHPVQGYPKLDDATNLNYWKSAITPHSLYVLRSEDIEIGDGIIAGCGSKVRLLLRGTKPDGGNFNESHDETKPLEFVVGNAPYDVLNQLISGMREHGVRTAKVPLFAVALPTKVPSKMGTALLRISLQSVDHPKASDNEIVYQALALAAGSPDSKPLACGEEARLAMEPVDGDGRYKKASEIRAVLGHNDFSLSVNRAAEGMRVGESRLVVAPKSWRQKNQRLVTRIKRLPLALPATKPAKN